jgi:hypothetical protein
MITPARFSAIASTCEPDWEADMGSEPPMEEWEQTFGVDLRPHLIPAGQPDPIRRPSGVDQLAPGAHAALSEAIGRCSLQDLLIVPGAARGCGWLRHRFVFTPPCVLGVGERAVALWVQAPPEPGIRALVPLGEIAAITLHAHGTRRHLLVTGTAGRLPVRYDVADDPVMEGLIVRLRRRAAGPPAPVPPVAARHAALLWLDPADEVATAGPRTRLIVVTRYELVILRPGRVTYVPRSAIQAASIRSRSLVLRSAGVDLDLGLRSRKTAAAAALWLERVPGDHHRSGTGS